MTEDAPTNVLLLAAGLGTRLRPTTDRLPKCLVPIDGVPLLDRWKAIFDAARVENVIINVHAHADTVRGHVERYGASSPRWLCAEEPILLGTAGTVRAQLQRLERGRDFVVAYADNYSSLDLTQFMTAHRRSGAPFTMALFDPPDDDGYGVVSLDGESRVVGFVEKPPYRNGGLANAGLYAVNSGFLGRYLGEGASDLSYDVLPLLIGQMHGWVLPGYHRDIGTPARWQSVDRHVRAQRLAGRNADIRS